MATKKSSTGNKSSALEAAKARLASMNKKGGGGDFPFNYLDIPSESKVVVRIFKGWDSNKDPGEFYKEVAYHRAIGPQSKFVMCPKGIGKPCPICEQVDVLRKKGLDLRKKDEAKGIEFLKKQVDPLKASPRFFMNAVALTSAGAVQTHKDGKGKAAEKPEVLAVGPMVMEQVLAAFVEDEADICGAFWEKKNRYDFLIKKTGQGLSTSYVVTPTRKYASVDTEKLVPHDLDDAFGEPLGYEELKAILNGETPPEEEKDEDEEQDEEQDEDSEDSEDEADEDSDDEDEDADEDEEEKPAKTSKKDSDEEADEDEDEDSDEEEADEDEADEEDSDDEDEDSDDEDEDEDEDSDEEEADEDEADEEDSDDEEEADEDEEKAKSAKKGKEKPICFGDPDDHNPKDAACKGCPVKDDCAATKAVSEKVYGVKGGGATFGQKAKKK